jgi:uncharacterized protein YkwD
LPVRGVGIIEGASIACVLVAFVTTACLSPAVHPEGADGSALHFEPRTAFATGATPGGIAGGREASELAADLRAKLPALTLENDGRLAELAARVAVETQGRRRPPSLTELDDLAREVGFVGPVPFVAALPRVGGTWQHLDDYLASIPNNMRFNRMGVSVLDFGGAHAAAVALGSEHVELASVPRRVAISEHVVLRGKVADEYRNPQLVWTRPDGTTKRASASTEGSIDVDSGPLERGMHRIEILATGPAGLEVVANFPLAVGVDVVGLTESAEAVDESDPKAAMLLLTNGARKRAGLAPLELDAALESVAYAHSQDMVSAGFFGHQSPTTGTVDDRMKAARLRVTLVGENVARAPSPRDAHAMLMASPGHRDNILNPRFSRVGIGVVFEPGKNPPAFTVTEVFGAYASPLPDLAAAAAASFAAIARKRAQSNLPALTRMGPLDDVARDVARRVLAEPTANLSELVPKVIGRRLTGVVHGAPLILTSYPIAPEDVANDEHLAEAKFHRMGVALAQSTETPPTTVAVVILAQ